MKLRVSLNSSAIVPFLCFLLALFILATDEGAAKSVTVSAPQIESTVSSELSSGMSPNKVGLQEKSIQAFPTRKCSKRVTERAASLQMVGIKGRGGVLAPAIEEGKIGRSIRTAGVLNKTH